MTTESYTWHTTVRNYELDNQGIVNNATYLNYLEEARNGYVQHIALDLHAFAKEGFHFVVSNISIDYRNSLMHNDAFYVTTALTNITDRRLIFTQDIFHQNDNRLIAHATVSIACINLKTRRSCMPDKLTTFVSTVID